MCGRTDITIKKWQQDTLFETSLFFIHIVFKYSVDISKFTAPSTLGHCFFLTKSKYFLSKK